MNALTSGKLDCHIQLANGNGLGACAFDVDFNATDFFIVKGVMLEGAQIKVAIQFAIHSSEQIQIESGGNTERVIVGGFENGPVLFQVCTKQQRVTLTQYGTQRAQKDWRFSPAKVTDIRAQEQREGWTSMSLAEFFQGHKIIGGVGFNPQPWIRLQQNE